MKIKKLNESKHITESISGNTITILPISGINSDGFKVIVNNEAGEEIFKQEYRYGINASYDRKFAKYAEDDIENAKKYNWKNTPSPKPYVADIINGLCNQYDINKNDIQFTPGDNTFTGDKVSDSFTNKIKKLILDESKSINESISIELKNYLEKVKKLELKAMYSLDPDDDAFGIETDLYARVSETLDGKRTPESLLAYFEKYYSEYEKDFIDNVKKLINSDSTRDSNINESKSTHCVYFTQDGINQIEFEGTEDECNRYISDIQAEQDDEFGDEAPERFIKRLDESKVSDFPEDTEAGEWLKALLMNADLELENPKVLDHYIGKDFADFTLDINGDVNRYRIRKGGKVTIKESLREALGSDYSHIEEIKSINYNQDKDNMLPYLDCAAFTQALEETGLDAFKIRTTRLNGVSNEDLRDEFGGKEMQPWKYFKDWDNSVEGFNEFYFFFKTDKLPIKETLTEGIEMPFMFHYNCNNPTYGYDFQQFATKLGAKKVYGKWKGSGQGRYFYLVPSEDVYNKLKAVAKDKFTVDMQQMLPYNKEEYPNIQVMRESLNNKCTLDESLFEAAGNVHSIRAGDTLESKSGHKIYIRDIVAQISPFEKQALVTFEYDYEKTDGQKGRSSCSTHDLKAMLMESINLSEASYGGAFDIADDQYFTREDIESAAEEVMNHIDETFTEKYVLGGTWFEKGRWIVNVQSEDGAWEFEELIRIDMRKIKEPWHLKREYAMEMAAKLINSIKYQTQPITEELNESDIIDAEPIETGAEVGMAAIISDLIKDEYEAIDGYNSAIATAQAEGFLDMVNVLSEIQAEENLHIGQLQTLMNSVDPNAHLVDDGQQEGIEQLANPIAAEVVEESIQGNDLKANAEQAFQDNELDLFVCDALKDGLATEKDLMLIAIQSSIIEEDDMKKAIASCK